MALQEFLASYAVQVDEDGARRLQAVLEENRSAGQELAAVFEAARSALAGLKKELSDASGLQGVLTALRLGAAGGSGLPGNSRLPVVSGASSVSGSYRYTPSALAGFSGLSAGSSLLSVGADFSAAEEALAAFRSRMESERPRLSVNTSGITSAVSGAVSSIRSMLSSVRVSVPVTAVPKLNLSGMNSGGGNPGGSSGGSTGGSSGAVPTISAAHYGSGGRVASPTLAVIAEEGRPEYVIPTDNESRASSLLRGLLSEVSDSVRNTLVSDLLASVRSSFVPDPNLSGPESGSDGRISGSVPQASVCPVPTSPVMICQASACPDPAFLLPAFLFPAFLVLAVRVPNPQTPVAPASARQIPACPALTSLKPLPLSWVQFSPAQIPVIPVQMIPFPGSPTFCPPSPRCLPRHGNPSCPPVPPAVPPFRPSRRRSTSTSPRPPLPRKPSPGPCTTGPSGPS